MSEKPDFVIRREEPTGEAGNFTIPPALVGIDPLRGRASRGECPMKKSRETNLGFNYAFEVHSPLEGESMKPSVFFEG